MDAPAPRTLLRSDILRLDGGGVQSLAVAADGSVAIECDDKGLARMWDLSGSGTMLAILGDSLSEDYYCALSADGSVAATQSWDGWVRVWDARSGREQRLLRRDNFDFGTGCALSADGSVLVAAFCDDDFSMALVVLYDWLSDRILDEFTRSHGAALLSASGDGAQLALHIYSSDSACAQSKASAYKVEVIDRRSGLSRVFSCNSGAHFAMSYSGSHVAIAEKHQLRLFEIQGGGEPTAMRGYRCGKYAFCAMTANASHVVATAPDNSYSVWDTTTGSVVATLPGCEDATRRYAMSADASRIITWYEYGTLQIWPTSITTAINIGPALESSRTAVASSAQSRYKINPDIRYDLCISFYGNESICPGIRTRDVARETRDVALEKSGELASVFIDDCVAGRRDEKRFEAILQTRGGGTVLFLLTKEFFNTHWCLKELRAALHVHARGAESGNGGKFKLRLVCFDSSADETLSHAQEFVPQLRDYRITRILRTSLEEMGNTIAKIVEGAWREDPRTLFGGSAKDSLFEVARLFRDDVTVARWELNVAGDDIHTILHNAMQGPLFGLHNVERLRKVAAMSSNQMARREKEKGVKTYTAKWIDSRGWNWTVEGAIGAQYSSSG